MCASLTHEAKGEREAHTHTHSTGTQTYTHTDTHKHTQTHADEHRHARPSAHQHTRSEQQEGSGAVTSAAANMATGMIDSQAAIYAARKWEAGKAAKYRIEQTALTRSSQLHGADHTEQSNNNGT